MGRLTESEFSEIVADVAASMWKIESASAIGFTVDITFSTRSGKGSVAASLHFDDDTGRCTTIYCPYTDANQPRFFADEVERRIDLVH